jgi:predicted dehydrogenase
VFNETEAVVIKREDLNDKQDPYEWELTSFFDWVEHDTAPLFTGETGRANVAVADAAYRSLESGVWEDVG